ncbi:MAG: helix-turn-helix transcriptional regulator [Ruminococcus sp.]|nr:helix-turn-helix transcriptional regulator [Ruminococcus sp.]
MRITGIELGCRKSSAADGRADDCELYIFRSPVTVRHGGSELTAGADTALLLTAGQERTFRPSDGMRIRGLVCDIITFHPASADRQYLASLNAVPGQPVRIPDPIFISNTLRSMKARFGLKGRYHTEFMELSLRLILVSIYGEGSEEAAAPDTPKGAQLRRLRENIYADPTGDWDIDSICRDLRISKAYFHRLYLAQFGVSCRQDVIESRLLCAEELLLDPTLSIADVAEQSGYDSDSYFMRQFRQHRGCTPTEYRRTHTGAEDGGENEQ